MSPCRKTCCPSRRRASCSPSWRICSASSCPCISERARPTSRSPSAARGAVTARSRSSSRCAGRSRPRAPPPWSGTGTSIVSEGLRFLLGVHNHQPVGNFDSVVLEAAAQAYHPFLEAAGAGEGMVVNVHCSGGLLSFLRERAPATFDLLGLLVSSGRVEILTGGFYEPILSMLPDEDKVGQIQALTEFLRANFGVCP